MGLIYSKQDFLDRAAQVLDEYPELAVRWRSGDPFIVQQIGAMAHMLALLSLQIGLAETEPWTRARDVTVLADAAAKGILPLGKPAVRAIRVSNAGMTPYTLYAGRNLLDNQGRNWVVTTTVTVPAAITHAQNELTPGSATVDAEQRESSSFTHTVSAAQDFYRIPLPAIEDGKYLAAVTLAAINSDDSRLPFNAVRRYNNVSAGETVFHLESDETGALSIVFGMNGVGGYRPANNMQFAVTLNVTYGDISLPDASPLVFVHADDTGADRALSLTAGDERVAGARPMSISALRELLAFPSLFDEDAVYLGNFQFLILRHLSPFTFLSVWNEQIEEHARGASDNNINTLFVSFIKEGAEADTTEQQISAVVAAADNSYRLKFVPAAEKYIPLTLSLRLPPTLDLAGVSNKARQALLDKYGKTSDWARRGRGYINVQETVVYLRDTVVELQSGCDFSLQVGSAADSATSPLPEEFRYVTAESITINHTPLWVY